MSEHDPGKLADEGEQEAGQLQRHSDELQRELEETRQDWERKRRDENVPGAAPPGDADAAPEASSDSPGEEPSSDSPG